MPREVLVALGSDIKKLAPEQLSGLVSIVAKYVPPVSGNALEFDLEGLPSACISEIRNYVEVALNSN